jgi:hypothetical protein
MLYHVDLTTPETVARQTNTVNPDGAVPVLIVDQATGQYVNFFAFVTDMCKAASKIIAEQTMRSFVPYIADLDLIWDDVRDDVCYDRYLKLPEDLLILSELTFGELTIGSTDYRLSPTNTTPYDTLYLSPDAMDGATYDWDAMYTLSGTWGYVQNLSQAWTVAQSSLSIGSDSTTSITVTLSTAINYERLQYLKIGTEYMQITDIDTDTDVLTVIRGVNGTTAAIHSSAALYRFNVIDDVKKAATELAVYFYTRRTSAGNVQFSDGTVAIDSYPVATKDMIKEYQRGRWAKR